MRPRQSGLVIEIPEAEPAVAAPRIRLDRVAALGVPAHVTALFPFVAPDDITEAVLSQVSEVAAANAPFDYRFARTAWFGQQVVYLAPDQPAPFIKVTESLWAAVPECPPYGGRFEEL
ncbi:MAG TPA: 2'-5' RNA ligase family protein, partial [Dermatophilaceae bacterium]|nr:2'-5' RNA ligase family protein [Dermatophilaceae bacterium]